MSGTLSHNQSELVSRADLLRIPPPPATATWRPIAHGDLIAAIDRQLLVRGVTIRKEAFAVQRGGARLFAVLDLSIESSDEFSAAMGIRTANDRSMALEIAVGIKVFVCDNLAFSGDLIALRRKHTAKFDLNADISRAVDRYQTHLLVFDRQIAELKSRALSNEQAKGLIHDAFAESLLPLRMFSAVSRTYFGGQDFPDVAPRSAWGLHNAFTRAIGQMAPAPAFAASIRLARLFGMCAQAREKDNGT